MATVPQPAPRPTRRALFPGFEVPAISLGGAMLGGIDPREAASILRVAAEIGIELVDTSSAYGLSESVIGHAPAALSVATKFGNPCERNGERHDYSTAHCVDSLYASLAALQGKRLACYQLHSPPEFPSPLVPALVDLLETLRQAGKFGAWGASVHSVNGGQVALAAGAQMLQVPYNLLQQDNGAPSRPDSPERRMRPAQPNCAAAAAATRSEPKAARPCVSCRHSGAARNVPGAWRRRACPVEPVSRMDDPAGCASGTLATVGAEPPPSPLCVSRH
eukprot:6810666-Prymnesium_polylepis.1